MKKQFTIRYINRKPIAFETVESFIARGGQIQRAGKIIRVNFRNEAQDTNRRYAA